MPKLTTAEKKIFKNTAACPICGDVFSDDNPAVRHHDHVSDKFLHAACNGCNLQLKPRNLLRPHVPKIIQYQQQDADGNTIIVEEEEELDQVVSEDPYDSDNEIDDPGQDWLTTSATNNGRVG
jgi:hypothetical protein